MTFCQNKQIEIVNYKSEATKFKGKDVWSYRFYINYGRSAEDIRLENLTEEDQEWYEHPELGGYEAYMEKQRMEEEECYEE